MPPTVSLTNFVPQETAVFYPLIPGNAERLGWEITFGGPSHPKTIAAADKASRRSLARSAEIEKAQINGRKWKGDMDKQPEDVRRDFIQGLVDRMVSWTPVSLNINGEEKEFPLREGKPGDEAGAVDLLLRPEMSPYVGQIVDWLLDDKAFMKGSATAS